MYKRYTVKVTGNELTDTFPYSVIDAATGRTFNSYTHRACADTAADMCNQEFDPTTQLPIFGRKAAELRPGDVILSVPSNETVLAVDHRISCVVLTLTDGKTPFLATYGKAKKLRILSTMETAS
jgi:hypothetical protein